MAGQNLSPRQKMIGMMYLVLTALLALNVSKEIINAFVTINDSLEVTVKNLQGKNAQAYSAFDKQMQNDKAKTEPFFKKAQVVKKQCEDLDKYVAALKEELIRTTDKMEAGAKMVPLGEMKAKDNYDEPTRIMCGDKQDGRGHKATELKEKINGLKKNIIATLDAKDRDKFTKRLDDLFDTKDPVTGALEDGKKTWEMANFYHNPVVATVALLSKIQTDVKNAESEIITHLLSAINAADFKFDTLAPKVIAPSSYVIEGQEYSADIFLAAMSSTSDPEITVGGSSLTVDGGVGTYKVRASGIGEKKYAGLIKVKKPDNTYESYPFESSYIVAKPSASVAADKMNVIYIGVPNPITVSVPGVPDEKVKAIPTGFALSPDAKAGRGHFIAEAKGQPGEAKIVVSADFNGKPMQMGEFKFRLKRIPDPVAKIGGKKDGNIPKSALAAQQGIIPTMENFDFDLYPKVTSFKMSRYGKGRDPVEKSAEGGALTGDMKSIIDQCRAGDKILFEYIKVSMPDGTTRTVNSIPLTVQ
ncbi:MAG: gliding motility protein GldM [Bacteroidetes bacterium]|nr:gliding motility protein GldM [Bacteroidota bacterium]MBL0096408.1 gliding motility protein GldM [Bacteroidota bacterium]